MSTQKNLSGVVAHESHTRHRVARQMMSIGGALVGGLLLVVLASLMVSAHNPMAPNAPSLGIVVTSEPRHNNDNPLYWVSSGDRITYSIELRNTGDPMGSTLFTSTIPSGTSYVSGATTPTPSVNGDVLTWNVGTLDNSASYYITLVVELTESHYIMHEVLWNYMELTGWWEGNSYRRPLDLRHYVESATIVKSHTSSIAYAQNTLLQAVAGETVTMTVFYTIPEGTVAYSVTPRIILVDGLWPDATTPATVSSVLTTTAYRYPNGPLDSRAAGDGYQLEFEQQDVITGPQTLEFTVVAHPRQYRYLQELVETPGGLFYQAILRWCDGVSCAVADLESNTSPYRRDLNAPSVSFVRPNARVEANDFTHTYDDPLGIGVGGGGVTLDMIVRSNGPIAYEMVFTATLGPGLTYVDSTGGAPPSGGAELGEGSHWTEGDVTYITWTLPFSMPHGTLWNVQVEAGLPSTFTVGTTFTATADVKSETFPGDVVDEGTYVRTRLHTLRSPQTGDPNDIAGVSNSKFIWSPEKDGTTWVAKIGDTINYTVETRLGSNTILENPFYTDTLPVGFHYVAGSFAVEGVTLTGGPYLVDNDTFDDRQDIAWYMSTLDRTGHGSLIFTATYRAELTGYDTYGDAAYAANLGTRNVPNYAVLYYEYDGGYAYLNETTAIISVRQPNLRNNNFTTSRTDSSDGDEEVGARVRFQIRFRNTGGVTGYDLTVCDELPQGLGYFPGSTLYNPPTACPDALLIVEPDDYAEGDICWVIDTVCRNVDFGMEYEAEVLPEAVPGIPRTNNAFVSDYSSQPGGTNDGDADDNDLPTGVTYDRHYMDFPAIALPDEKQCTTGCPFTVLGLAGSKSAWQSSVVPGDLITYTLAYTNTSASQIYDGLVITDSYGDNLLFVAAVPAPDVNDLGQATLVWDISETLNGGDNGQIVLTLQVESEVLDQYEVENTMEWDTNQTSPHTWVETTPLEVPSINLQMTSPMTTHAGEVIAYNVVYSNTGSTSRPVTLTLDYGDYVAFDSFTTSEGDVTQVGGTDNVFVDALVPNDSANYVLTVYVTVGMPLPYDLDHLTGTVTADSDGMPQKSDSVAVNLDRPVITLDKTGPSVAAPPTPPGNVMEYTINIVNDGTYTATGVVLTDTWGANTAYDNFNHTVFGWTEPAPSADSVTRTLDLGVGESVSFTFRVQVTGVAPFYMNTVDMTTDQTSIQTDMAKVWSSSVATTKSATPIPAFPGRVLTYTIYYTNTNPSAGAFTNVIITDTLPTNFVYQGHTEVNVAGCPGGWSFTEPGGSGGGDAVWACASLNNNLSGQLLIWGEISPSAEGTNLTNVTESSGTGIATRPIEEPLITWVARPWLRVSKSAVPTPPVAPGDLITYTLIYENYGTDPAYNVQIADTLPAQVEFENCSDGCTSGSTVTWSISEVPTGTVGSVELVVRVKEGTGGQTAVNDICTIRSDRLPTDETTPCSPVSTQILGPHVSVTKEATPTLVTVLNASITYTITYVNDGGGTVTNVTIVDELSSMTTFDSASPECNWSGSGLGGTVTCNVGDLAQGESSTVEIVVLAGIEGLITNTAVVDSDQITPLESDPPTEVYFSTSGCIPPYGVDFAVSPDPKAGEVITFTGSTSGDAPLTYGWTFGDTASDTGQEVYHTYAVSGTYAVELTVSNACNPAGDNVQKDVFAPGEPEIAVYLPLVIRN